MDALRHMARDAHTFRIFAVIATEVPAAAGLK